MEASATACGHRGQDPEGEESGPRHRGPLTAVPYDVACAHNAPTIALELPTPLIPTDASNALLAQVIDTQIAALQEARFHLTKPSAIPPVARQRWVVGVIMFANLLVRELCGHHPRWPVW